MRINYQSLVCLSLCGFVTLGAVSKPAQAIFPFSSKDHVKGSLTTRGITIAPGVTVMTTYHDDKGVKHYLVGRVVSVFGKIATVQWQTQDGGDLTPNVARLDQWKVKKLVPEVTGPLPRQTNGSLIASAIPYRSKDVIHYQWVDRIGQHHAIGQVEKVFADKTVQVKYLTEGDLVYSTTERPTVFIHGKHLQKQSALSTRTTLLTRINRLAQKGTHRISDQATLNQLFDAVDSPSVETPAENGKGPIQGEPAVPAEQGDQEQILPATPVPPAEQVQAPQGVIEAKDKSLKLEKRTKSADRGRSLSRERK